MSAAMLALAACGTTESGSLLTRGMSAEMTINAPGDGTATVSTELFSGSPGQLIYVDLDNSDTLTATSNGQTMTLTKSQLGNIIDYDAAFTSGASGEQFVIALVRTVDAGAPTSTVTLPDAFTLAALPASQSRASALTIAWSPTGSTDPTSWAANGSCIAGASGTITVDQGTLGIPAGTLVAAPGQASASCSVTVTFTRTRAGTLDPHFGDGGAIAGQQTRTATFTSTP
jgi:hypothetical protein